MSKLTLESAIQMAAATLPEGYTLQLTVERHSGSLKLTTPDGDDLEIPTEPNDPFANQIIDAVLAAQQHAGKISTENGLSDQVPIL